ncbi:hypothetical protein D0T66_06125 [Dysgonomonas sp. 25]|nr:hypothetical protein [Dysgonomonas sp. 25]
MPGDNPDLTDIGEDLIISKENIEGTWELFYTSKKVNTTREMREPSDDGATVDFLSNGRYTEENSLGEDGLDEPGYYSIVNGGQKQDSLKFVFVSPITGEDTTTYAFIHQLTPNIMIRKERYSKKDTANTSILYNVTDYLYFRRLPVTKPDKTFGLIKTGKKEEFVKNDYINGKWVLMKTMERRSTDGVSWSNLEDIYTEANGSTYEFRKASREFEEVGPNGNVGAVGDYRLIDDVVHLYYLGPNNVPMKTVMRIQEQKENSFIWYREDVTFSSTAKFTILRQYSYYERID